MVMMLMVMMINDLLHRHNHPCYLFHYHYHHDHHHDHNHDDDDYNHEHRATMRGVGPGASEIAFNTTTHCCAQHTKGVLPADIVVHKM